MKKAIEVTGEETSKRHCKTSWEATVIHANSCHLARLKAQPANPGNHFLGCQHPPHASMKHLGKCALQVWPLPTQPLHPISRSQASGAKHTLFLSTINPIGTRRAPHRIVLLKKEPCLLIILISSMPCRGFPERWCAWYDTFVEALAQRMLRHSK